MRQVFGIEIRHLVIAAAAVVLSSCASYELDRARDITPSGDPFTQALYDAYLTYAVRAFEEDNKELSDAFAARAIAAGNGTVVAPAVPAAAALKSGAASIDAFEAGRARLMAALEIGRSTQPGLSADAQAAFDCWYLRSIDPESDAAAAARCRSEFDARLVALEDTILPDPASFTAYFGFDEWFLRADALDVISTAMETARIGGHSEIVLGGHTDTAGSAAYNQKLSVRRAEAVKATMVELGALAEAIVVVGYGQTQLAIATGDGVAEALNRRVVIDLVP